MSRNTGDAVYYLIQETRAAVAVFKKEGTTFPDANTSAGFGQIIEGLTQLLNEKITPYDGGLLYQSLESLADQVAWSLDESEIDYERK